MKTTLPILALALLLAAFPARADDAPVSACSCTPRAFAARFQGASAVFTGTVREIEVQDKLTKKGNGRWSKTLMQADPPVTVTLDILTPYKGVGQKKTFTLNTSLTKYTCSGYPFTEGRDYLVFAYRRDDPGTESTSLYGFPPDTYEVGGLCGGTKEIEKAADDLARMKPEDVAAEAALEKEAPPETAAPAHE